MLFLTKSSNETVLLFNVKSCTIINVNLKVVQYTGSLQHSMVRFLAGVPSSEGYRDAIEHKVGRELTSAARECSSQIIECCMGFYGRQFVIYTHARTHAGTHAHTY
jgi:hypothetical protein